MQSAVHFPCINQLVQIYVPFYFHIAMNLWHVCQFFSANLSIISETTKKKVEILRFQDSHLIIYIMMWLLALDDVAVLFLAEGFETEGVVRVVEVGGGVDGLAVDARLEV